MDKQILVDQIDGLKAHIKKLREEGKLFSKRQTLEETAQKEKQKSEDIASKIEEVKDSILQNKIKRTEMLSSATSKICAEIDKFLPYGKSVISIEEGLFIGWEKEPGKCHPWQSLSGGEDVIFSAAVSNAFLQTDGLKVIIIEAGELDAEKLKLEIDHLRESFKNIQIIINTPDLPEGFNPGEEWKIFKL